MYLTGDLGLAHSFLRNVFFTFIQVERPHSRHVGQQFGKWRAPKPCCPTVANDELEIKDTVRQLSHTYHEELIDKFV